MQATPWNLTGKAEEVPRVHPTPVPAGTRDVERRVQRSVARTSSAAGVPVSTRPFTVACTACQQRGIPGARAYHHSMDCRRRYEAWLSTRAPAPVPQPLPFDPVEDVAIEHGPQSAGHVPQAASSSNAPLPVDLGTAGVPAEREVRRRFTTKTSVEETQGTKRAAEVPAEDFAAWEQDEHDEDMVRTIEQIVQTLDQETLEDEQLPVPEPDEEIPREILGRRSLSNAAGPMFRKQLELFRPEW